MGNDFTVTEEVLFPMSDILAYRAPLVGSDRWLIPILKGYLALTKPRIAALITFTALVGEFLASRTLPPLPALCWGTLGIALSCASAATLNQLFERGTDADMSRTRARPLPSGQLTGSHAFLFAVILGSVGLSILALLVNVLTAILTFATLRRRPVPDRTDRRDRGEARRTRPRIRDGDGPQTALRLV